MIFLCFGKCLFESEVAFLVNEFVSSKRGYTTDSTSSDSQSFLLQSEIKMLQFTGHKE